MPTIDRAAPRVQLGLAFAAFVLIGAADAAVGVLLPSLQVFYHISKAVVGLLFLFQTVGYITAAFTSGVLVERLGRRRFLLLGAAAYTLGALAISRALPFPAMLGAALVLGFGFAVLDAGLNTFVTELPGNTARLNYLHACFGFGGFLGPAVVSVLLAVGGGWQFAYLLWAMFGGALVVGIARFFAGSAPPAASIKEGNVLSATLRMRVVWLAAIFLLFYVGIEISVGGWSYTYLTEGRHHALLLSGWAVSGYWLGITAGRLALARLAPRLHLNDRALIGRCLAVVVVGLLLVWLVPLAFAPGLFLVGVAFGPIFPTVIALVPSLVPSRLVSSAVGFLASLGSMGGALFPWLAGNVAHAAGVPALLPYFLALAGILIAGWLALEQGLRSRTEDWGLARDRVCGS